MHNQKFDLEDRFVVLGSSIALFCKDIFSDFEGQYSVNQLLCPGGSVAFNFNEAQGTTSHRYYRYKASLVLKELNESWVNLRILRKIDYGLDDVKSMLLNEIEQLVKLISTIISNKNILNFHCNFEFEL